MKKPDDPVEIPKRQQKSTTKRASRWRFPNDRYSEKMASRLRFLFAEPHSFHQGARLAGYRPMSKQFRAFIRKEKIEARNEIYGQSEKRGS